MKVVSCRAVVAAFCGLAAVAGGAVVMIGVGEWHQRTVETATGNGVRSRPRADPLEA